MPTVNLGICQMPVVEEKKENLKTAAAYVAAAAVRGCRIVILPEMFNCPYQTELFAAYAESYPHGETLQLLGALAARHRVVLVGGSIPERDSAGRIYNTCFVFDRNGSLLGKHRKVHLFDIAIAQGTQFQESAVITAGNAGTVLTVDGLRLGVAICYDLRFPELARAMVLQGADILIYPAAFSPVTGPVHWELLLRARAVDNQVFTVGVSPAATPGAAYQPYGHSLVVDPWGEPLGQCGSQEELLCVAVDLTRLQKVRQELPLLQHRRPDLY
ncbi:carbon-nitrogen hydrolase family protein [Propionispora vibrioides]|uniref:Predicted amidohydrolase n=1 Tax=Propionispora vibrioides TaxID=112903 RepID=A0A1H8XKG5_9FIRM|nr:carbon-nitrogen hydrolase family protein [Propionispora vibrioides]SEP40395.1 Predicted amidohydrolase [Propionispora vibrioides]